MVIGNQRVMTAVGRFPTSHFWGSRSVGSDGSDGFSAMCQFVNAVDRVCQVGAVVGSVAGGVGAFFWRGGRHPRRTGAITYPSQKGSHTFSVCQTNFGGVLGSLSTGYYNVKSSDNIMSRWRRADNCADNCADKVVSKLLILSWLCRCVLDWCADNCADKCANTKESIRILIKGRCWGWGGGVAYG